MFKPIVCKAKTNITIPYSGTKKEKLEFIDRTARTFCENFDTYLQINNQKNFIKKKELIALFSELFPGLKINIGRVSSKEAGTDAATRREEDCYIMRLKPLKSKNMLVNILDYFRPLKIEKNLSAGSCIFKILFATCDAVVVFPHHFAPSINTAPLLDNFLDKILSEILALYFFMF